MLCQRFVRTTPGETALTRIGANLDRQRTRQGFDGSANARGNHPALLWALASYPVVSTIEPPRRISGLPYLTAGEDRAIAQFKRLFCLTEISSRRVALLEAIANRIYQVIDWPMLRKEGSTHPLTTITLLLRIPFSGRINSLFRGDPRAMYESQDCEGA
jgi:hypothetical protein